MPKKHQAYLEEEKDASLMRLRQWAKEIGPNTTACEEQFFKSRHLPQQGIRAVLGLKRLSQQYGQDVFEKACQKTLSLHQYRYR
jgi:hypothetical protein